MNRELKRKALKILSCLDLTLLEDNATSEQHDVLIKKATSAAGNVAAVCVNPQWAAYCRQKLPSSVSVACVVNFPGGDLCQKEVFEQLDLAIKGGAQEIDYVLDYKSIKKGQESEAGKKLQEVADYLEKKWPATVLKVILEVGELEEENLIKIAAELAIGCGADFIKTSTGKVKINATLEFADIMLKSIDNCYASESVGFKAAGGIRTVEQAYEYLSEYESRFGANKATKKNFRIGASSLYEDILKKSGFDVTQESSSGGY